MWIRIIHIRKAMHQRIRNFPPLVGIRFFSCSTVLFLRKTSTLDLSNHNTYSYMLEKDFKCGFLLAILPYSPDKWCIKEIVVTCIQSQYLPKNSCSYFNFARGLLAAFVPYLIKNDNHFSWTGYKSHKRWKMSSKSNISTTVCKL